MDIGMKNSLELITVQIGLTTHSKKESTQKLDYLWKRAYKLEAIKFLRERPDYFENKVNASARASGPRRLVNATK